PAASNCGACAQAHRRSATMHYAFVIRSSPNSASTATSFRCHEHARLNAYKPVWIFCIGSADPVGERMNWTDYIIIGIIALSVLIGLWRGLISEVLALAIWIVAFWVAWTFGPT